MLNVTQARVLSCQLIRDPFVFWVLWGQNQAGVVAQFTQVLKRLEENQHEEKSRIRTEEHENRLTADSITVDSCGFG